MVGQPTSNGPGRRALPAARSSKRPDLRASESANCATDLASVSIAA